jgi:hypothetical protein
MECFEKFAQHRDIVDQICHTWSYHVGELTEAKMCGQSILQTAAKK